MFNQRVLLILARFRASALGLGRQDYEAMWILVECPMRALIQINWGLLHK
jgi:hypothetical protein